MAKRQSPTKPTKAKATTPVTTQVTGTTVAAPQAGAGEAIQLTTPNGEQLAPVVTQALKEGDNLVEQIADAVGELSPVTQDAANAIATTLVQTLTAEDDTARETVIAPEGETQTAIVVDEQTEAVREKIGPYLEAYPHETMFHLTGDGNVFLGADSSIAREHQATLKDGSDLYTYRVQAGR